MTWDDEHPYYVEVKVTHFLVIHQGVVKIGAVDADQHKSLGSQFSIRGFPTIKIFGANKNKPEDYQGNVMTLSGAVFVRGLPPTV